MVMYYDIPESRVPVLPRGGGTAQRALEAAAQRGLGVIYFSKTARNLTAHYIMLSLCSVMSSYIMVYYGILHYIISKGNNFGRNFGSFFL